MKEIYIAGPMTGIPCFNFPAFNYAERVLQQDGWTVHNPAAKDAEVITIDTDAYRKGDASKAIKSGFDFREAYLWTWKRSFKETASTC